MHDFVQAARALQPDGRRARGHPGWRRRWWSKRWRRNGPSVERRESRGDSGSDVTLPVATGRRGPRSRGEQVGAAAPLRLARGGGGGGGAAAGGGGRGA